MAENPYSRQKIRGSALRYVGGRAVNAVLAFTSFVLVAQLLAKEEYGYYVAALVAFEVVMYLSSLGLEWVGGVYVPQYRMYAPGKPLNRFVIRLASAQCASLIVGGSVLILVAPQMAAGLRLPDAYTVIQVYGFVAMIEGMSRMVRDQLLGALLEQGAAQFSQLVRNAVFTSILLGLSFSDSTVSAKVIALAELCSAGFSLAFGSYAVVATLRKAGRESSDPARFNETWSAPSTKEIVVLARSAYFNMVCAVAYGPQVLTMLVARYLGAEGAAIYGFARNLTDQFSRYMPAMFFLGFARPVFSAQYALTRDHVVLGESLIRYLKINLVFLVPVLAFFIGYGDSAVQLLGDGKFQGAWLPLLLLLTALLPSGIKIVLDLGAYVLHRAALSVSAALPLVVMPFLVAALLDAGFGLIFVAGSVALAPTVYSLVLVVRMAASGVSLPLGWSLIARFMLAVGAASVAVAALPDEPTPSGIVLAGLTAVIAGLLSTWVTQLVTRDDRHALAALLGRGA